MPLAVFGIENDGLNLAVNLLILFLVVVYLALIAYTYLDAKRRLDDPVLIGCATVASLFPFVGTIVYTILRPPEFLEDTKERDLEIRAAELRVRQLEEASCPNCEYPVERSFLRCPNCRTRIKDPCESCGKPVDPRWTVCPYCETALRQPEPSRRQAATAKRGAARPATRAERSKRPRVNRASGGADSAPSERAVRDAREPNAPARRAQAAPGRTQAPPGSAQQD